MLDDCRIELAAIGRGPEIIAMQEIANDWAAEEGSFKIGMNRARCRCFDGLLEIAQSDGTKLDQLACGCALARHVGQGSAKREPVRLRLGVRGLKRHCPRSLHWQFTQFPVAAIALLPMCCFA
jgi:hypothetical protein